MPTIQVLLKIGGDVSIFLTAKRLVSRAGSYFKPILIQVANALIKSKTHHEFTTCYKRIKTHRGHKKSFSAIRHMILIAIWHILATLKPYTPEVFLESRT